MTGERRIGLREIGTKTGSASDPDRGTTQVLCAHNFALGRVPQCNSFDLPPR